MSSPAPFMSQMSGAGLDTAMGEVSTRSMRVKILYSFDANHSTNCLARLPNALPIPAVLSDEGVPIGVIELQQCVQAIVTASPEIMSGLLEGDFTIYAYDYSEPDAPLVGQGMLSAILSGEETEASGSDDDSPALVTGRVTRNMMGLFSKGAAETLEVKLRLVPVNKPSQTGFSKSMELQRNPSPALSQAADLGAWNGQYNNASTLISNLEQQSQMFGQRQPPCHHRRGSVASVGAGPMSSVHQRDHSRPLSRSSAFNGHQPHMLPRSQSFAGIMEEPQDDGPARKRVKVTQTDWRGKSNFAGGADSLRVTASTAASIRVHKPVATRPTLAGGNNLEPPPRVPTPVPQGPSQARAKGQVASLLRRESTLLPAQIPRFPYDNQSDAAMSSPEGMTVEDGDNSPLEFPSSPPQAPEPSSPTMPVVSGLDSGYMSGGVTDDIASDSQPYKVVPQRSSYRRDRDPFIGETPGPPELLPTKMNTTVRQGKIRVPLDQLERRSSLVLPPRPSLLATSSSGSLGIPQAQDPPTEEVVVAGQVSMKAPSRSAAASPAPSEGMPFGGKPRSGSGAKRKQAIQVKLLQSLAAGNMPTYCCNCGAIETPTWRTLYMKTFQGSPDDNAYEPIEGETRSIEVLERDEATNVVTQYRVVKSIRKKKMNSSIAASVSDFTTIQVCNPCGLWFNKFTYMRPPTKWVKKPGKGRRGGGLESDMLEPPSDFPHSDMPQSGLWTDQVMPEDTPMPDEEDEDEDEGDSSNDGKPGNQDANESNEAQASNSGSGGKTFRPTSSRSEGGQQSRPGLQGLEVNTNQARATQSSPGQHFGSKHSPIELDDLTPKPTRRLLFPSPRSEGQIKTLSDLRNGFSTPKKGGNKDVPASSGVDHANEGKEAASSSTSNADDTQAGITPKKRSANGTPSALFTTPRKGYSTDLPGLGSDPYIGLALSANKENFPHMTLDDDFASMLFDQSDSNIFKTPSKSSATKTARSTPPSKSLATFESLLQTPTPSKLNASLTRTPNRSMDAFLPSFSSAERRELLGTPSRYMTLCSTSPSRTLNVRSVSAELSLPPMTPFTRQLTQLLDEQTQTQSQSLARHHKTSSDEAASTSAKLNALVDMGPDPDGLGGLFSPATLAFAREARVVEFGSSPVKALDFGLSPAKHARQAKDGLGIASGS